MHRRRSAEKQGLDLRPGMDDEVAWQRLAQERAEGNAQSVGDLPAQGNGRRALPPSIWLSMALLTRCARPALAASGRAPRSRRRLMPTLGRAASGRPPAGSGRLWPAGHRRGRRRAGGGPQVVSADGSGGHSADVRCDVLCKSGSATSCAGGHGPSLPEASRRAQTGREAGAQRQSPRICAPALAGRRCPLY